MGTWSLPPREYMFYLLRIIMRYHYTRATIQIHGVVRYVVLLCRYIICVYIIYVIVVLPMPSIFRPKFGTINLCGWLRKALEVNTTVVGSL